jgi:predicted peptidase
MTASKCYAALATAIGCLLAAPVPIEARDPITGSVPGIFTDGPNSLPYREYIPAGAGAPGSSFPLVLFLHGAGERGTNNTSQVSSHVQGLIDRTETGFSAAYLLAPQCPTGQQWTDIPFLTGSYSNPTLNSPAISTPLRLALDLVEQFAETHNVDPNRIYITGLSMGGYGAFDAVARRPDLFAAALPLSGGGNLSAANIYKDVPIWAFHGAADTTVPPSGSRNTIAAIQNAGGTMERYTELAGQAHVIWAPIYNGGTNSFDTNYTGTYGTDGSGDAYTWMFAQTNVPEPSTAMLLFAGITALGVRRRR